MLEKYREEQKMACQILENEIHNKKLSHAYIIETDKNRDAKDFAFCMVTDIFGNKDLYNKIKNNNYPDFTYLETYDLHYKKEEVTEMVKKFEKKPILGKYKICLIKDANKLNENLSNSILKFIEEPEKGVIIILLVENKYQLLETIVSRCQVISLCNNNKYERTLENFYYLNNLYFTSVEQIYEEVDTIMKFCVCIEKYGKDAILYEDKYFKKVFSSKEDYYRAFEIMALLYYQVLNIHNENEMIYLYKYEDIINKMVELNSPEKIIVKLELVVDAKMKLLDNVNLSLLLDDLIIKLGDAK